MMAAMHRPNAPVFVITEDPAVMRQTGLVWGARAFLVDHFEYDETLIPLLKGKMKEAGFSGKAAVICRHFCLPMSASAPPFRS